MGNWDERYDTSEFLYGKEANVWVKENFVEPGAGKVALFAEGEGRNAVYMAELGYDAVAYDNSEKGLEKAQQLAEEKGVKIQTEYKDLTQPGAMPENEYDIVINIFGHVEKAKQQEMFNNMITAAKPGGIILFEFYSENQVDNGTGGPKEKDMLFRLDQVNEYIDTETVEIEVLEEKTVERYEGDKHTGKSDVIQGRMVKL